MRKFLLLVILLLSQTPVFAELKPEEIQNAYHKSYNYEKLQDYDNALKSLAPVLKEYPDTYTINLRMGWLHYLKKSYANAIEHYQKAVKIAPYSNEAKLGYILPLMDQAKYKEVEAVIEQVLNVDYYNYYANLRLAYVLRLQAKYDLAEKITNKMLAVYPTDVLYLTELGLVKDGQKNIEKANAIFWDIIVLDPENVTARNYLKLPKKTASK